MPFKKNQFYAIETRETHMLVVLSVSGFFWCLWDLYVTFLVSLQFVCNLKGENLTTAKGNQFP